jgi:SAM-dependent methyltransferase
MTKYAHFNGTREFVHHTLQYVKGSVLDLGSGRSKYQTTIRHACEKYTTLDLIAGPGVDVVSSIDETPFPDASFDTIYSTQVFEHIPKPWLAAVEILRLLKPGGVAIITAPFMQAFHADPNDYFRYTVAGLESLFELPDAELVESGAWGGAGSVVVDMFRKRYFSEYKPKKPGTWRLVHAMIAIGAWFDRKSADKPIIYLNTFVIVRKKA